MLNKRKTIIFKEKGVNMKHDLIVREPELYFDSIHQELDNFLRDTFFMHSFGFNYCRGDIAGREETMLCGSRVGGYTVEITTGENTLSEGRECCKADTGLGSLTKNAGCFYIAVEHIVASLVDEARDIAGSEIVVSHLGSFNWPLGYTDI